MKRSVVLLSLCAALTQSTDAHASPVSFGSHDVETVFFISKSDDRNRVDYGIHVNEHCAPTGDDAVFPYWREFENSPPVRTHTLGLFEYVPYGFSEQRLVHRSQTGGDQLLRLKQLDRPIAVRAHKDGDKCVATAYARIAGVEGAVFVSVYAKLSGATSVDYVDIHGKNPQTGADLTERVRK
jgi:hypothetical protein